MLKFKKNVKGYQRNQKSSEERRKGEISKIKVTAVKETCSLLGKRLRARLSSN